MVYMEIPGPAITQEQIIDALPNQSNIVYVGKHGNDANDGFKIEDALLTIQAGIDQAVAQVPAAGSRWVVAVIDDGTYIEQLTTSDFVDIWAPSATINGELTVADDSNWTIGRLLQTVAPVSGILKPTGQTGVTRLTVGYFQVPDDQTGLDCQDGTLIVEAQRVELINGSAGGVIGTADDGTLIVEAEEVYLTGATYGFNQAAGTGSIIVRCGKIHDDGSAIALRTAVVLNATVTEIDCATAYDVQAGGDLTLSVSRITGARTVAATGTSNVILAGDAPPISVSKDGGGAVVVAGTIGAPIFIPFEVEILGWYLTSDQPASTAQIDLWADTVCPPDNADTITGGNEPALTNQQCNSGGVAGWINVLPAGTWLWANLDAAPAPVAATSLSLVLNLRRR